MGLPEGWKIASLLEAKGYGLALGIEPVRLKDSFHFECVQTGECCQHPDAQPNGCTHFHSVGTIKWEKKQGIWRCPKLEGENVCTIHPERPLTCRLFPLGISMVRQARRVVVWKFKAPQRCLPCYDQPRRWTVMSWLAHCGFWDRIGPLCEQMDREGSVEL